MSFSLGFSDTMTCITVQHSDGEIYSNSEAATEYSLVEGDLSPAYIVLSEPEN